jgi:hypothetical protein
MKTKRAESDLPFKEKATGLESTIFHDGMVVTADDLETAARYPVSLLQSVLRSYFGCGVVCGLELTPVTKPMAEYPWVVRVACGLALDCQGFPIELTCPVELDFTPDPCAPGDLPSEVFIALRRITSSEPTNEPCHCSEHQTDDDCSRVRDRALVKAFTKEQLLKLPGGMCGQHAEQDQNSKKCANAPDKLVPVGDGEIKRSAAVKDWCTVLKECQCSCRGDWVLLGTVELLTGKPEQGRGIGTIDTGLRRWVKPTEAYCAPKQDVDSTTESDHGDRIATLEQLVESLSIQVDALASPPTPPPDS